jgi:bidirectional [NiFe] hydrogenase diaphorase subunit
MSPRQEQFRAIDIIMKRYQLKADALIEVLHVAQKSFGYLDVPALLYIARGFKLPLSRVYGVATFYHLFIFSPRADHVCLVCQGTACHLKGSAKILQAIQEELGAVQLSTSRCLGACGIAPVLVIDGQSLGRQTVETALKYLHLKSLSKTI